MSDRADEIARKIARGTFGFLALEPPDPEYRKKDEADYLRCEIDHEVATNLIVAIAAALRAYGDSKLSELIVCAEDYLDPGTQGEGEIWVTRSIIGHAKSLKSKPEPTA